MTTTYEMIGGASGLTATAGSIPQLQMAKNPTHGYGLMNWNQVDQWGVLNHPLWHRVHKMALAEGWDEVTKLRVLADALLRQNEQMSQTCKDLQAKLPVSAFFPSSNMESNHE